MEDKGNICKIPVGELEGNRQIARRSSKRKGITIDIEEVELGGRGLNWCGSGWEQMAGCNEQGNEI